MKNKEKTPDKRMMIFDKMKTYKNKRVFVYAEEDVHSAVHNILKRIWNIDLKTALGRNRLPSIILVEVEEIIKQEVGTNLAENPKIK